MSTQNHLLKALIQMGESGRYDLLEQMFSKTSPRTGRDLLKLNWQIKEYFPILSSGEIVSLIKALIEVENLGIYESGSTSQIYKMFHELRARSWNDIDDLEEWAFQHAVNCYVPFGNCGSLRQRASTAKEYRQFRSEWAHEVYVRQPENRRRRLEELHRQRAERYARQRERQKAVSFERQRTLSEMAVMSPSEKLSLIAKDNTHPPYYYSESFADVDDIVLYGLGRNTIDVLLIKLKTAPRGYWRRLYSRLTGFPPSRE